MFEGDAKMIVGVGKIPPPLIDNLRRLIDHPNIFIYPEFFDAKKELIQRNYVKYVQRFLENHRSVIIALYPDYLYDDRYGLCSFNVIWIFPLHKLSELDKIMVPCIEVIGFCGDEKLRDYSYTEFVDRVSELGYRMWMLGATRKQIQIASTLGFWGLDVTTWSTSRHIKNIYSIESARTFAQFLIKVANDGFRAKGFEVY